jgi:peptidoglycan hydrolase-like protein with peptidoglycan-binding domain
MHICALRSAVVLLVGLISFAAAAAGPAGRSPPQEPVIATPALVREIQFMLLSLGIDPGPIDGNPRQLTNRAVHDFQQRAGLPKSDLATDQPVSVAFLDELRREAAKVLLKNAPAPSEAATAIAPPPANPPPPPAAAVAAPPTPPQPPDRFAGCKYAAEDFLVGGRQYTPESFLDEGFGGVTDRAVASLRQRLDEARQIASKIGGPALHEVQRQAHVLAYFECRQQIERGSAASR